MWTQCALMVSYIIWGCWLVLLLDAVSSCPICSRGAKFYYLADLTPFERRYIFKHHLIVIEIYFILPTSIKIQYSVCQFPSQGCRVVAVSIRGVDYDNK